MVYRKKKNPKFNGHWGGFDLGINGYLTSDQRMDYSNIDGMNYNYLDLNMSKSIKVGINFFEQNLSLSKNQKWGLVTGLGWEINNYRFADKVSLLSDSSVIKGYYNDGVTVSKSKLVVNYLEVPLLLEFQTNKYRKSNSFHFTAGVVLGLRVTSHTKRVFEELNKEYYLTDPATGQQVLQTVSPGKKKAKTWDDFHLNPLKADATLRVGWGWINLFGTYSLTTLFKENKGPELYPFSIGLTLTSW